MNSANFSLRLPSVGGVRYEGPQVMGIVNATPDSFWAESRTWRDADALRRRVERLVAEGATMVDVGACSTRPGADEVSAEAELERFAWALPLVREVTGAAPGPIALSVDTYRADVAEACVIQWGADIVNDVCGGTADPAMLPTVARLGVPYVMTHALGALPTMHRAVRYDQGVGPAVSEFFSAQMDALRRASGLVAGSSAEAGAGTAPTPDVIFDPGFGFSKSVDQCYELLADLPRLIASLAPQPVLVGVSRKSMIFRVLATDVRHALNGTTVIHTLALRAGAAILRTHDVRECVEAVRLCRELARWEAPSASADAPVAGR